MAQPRQFQVTFDCADPRALSAFWGEALGFIQESPARSEGADDALETSAARQNRRAACHHPDSSGPRLLFLRVPEAKTVKNRVHLDVFVEPTLRGEERMTALEVEAQRLVLLGGSRVRRFEPDSDSGEIGFIVMRDPEGHEFCLD